MIKYILFLIFFFAILPIQAQKNIKVHLSPTNQMRVQTTYKTTRTTFIKNYQGIPNEVDSFAIHHLYIQPSQYYFQEWTKGHISNELWDTYTRENDWKAGRDFSVNIKIHSYIPILVAVIGKEQRKIIVFDDNFNNDFGDNIVYSYNDASFFKKIPTDNILKSSQLKEINFEFIYRDKKYSNPIRITFSPYTDYNTAYNLILDLSIFACEQTQGYFKLNKNRYSVLAGRTHFPDIMPNSPIELQFQQVDTIPMYAPVLVNVGEICPVDSFWAVRYQGLSIDRDTLYLQSIDLTYIPEGYLYGFRPNPLLELKTIKNKVWTLEKLYQKKYLLLHFWDVWQDNMLQQATETKAIRKSISTKTLNMVSIAYDNSPRIVEKTVKEQGLNWEHIVEPRNTKAFLIDYFKIKSFPTYILIDFDGKIIHRANNQEEYDILRNILRKLKIKK